MFERRVRCFPPRGHRDLGGLLVRHRLQVLLKRFRASPGSGGGGKCLFLDEAHKYVPLPTMGPLHRGLCPPRVLPTFVTGCVPDLAQVPGQRWLRGPVGGRGDRSSPNAARGHAHRGVHAGSSSTAPQLLRPAPGLCPQTNRRRDTNGTATAGSLLTVLLAMCVCRRTGCSPPWFSPGSCWT